MLHLGDSTTEWIAPYDRDRRRLKAMIADQLADPKRYFALHGGSYTAEIHDAYLQFALRVCKPRVVVVPLWYRGRFQPWGDHPIFGRKRAAAAIASMPAETPTWRIRRGFPRPAAEEWIEYAKMPFRTFAEYPVVGDYTRRLKDPTHFADDPDARVKLIYAYHLSHEIEADDPSLLAVERLGRRLRESGCAVVPYENPSPYPMGVKHWGDEFARVAANNWARLREALQRGFGDPLEILDLGMSLDLDKFLDPDVADEHLNEHGRTFLADRIVKRIAEIDPTLVRRAR